MGTSRDNSPKEMKLITFWKDLLLAIERVQVNRLNWCFSATLGSLVSAGTLGEQGLKLMAQGESFPRVDSKLCCHTTNKEDTKLNVPKVLEVII